MGLKTKRDKAILVILQNYWFDINKLDYSMQKARVVP